MKPRYEQVARELSERVTAQTYPPDSFLPSERSLCVEFDVSRITVRLGLQRLKELRLVEAMPGKGYRVTNVSDRDQRATTHFIGGVFAGNKNPETTGPMSDAAAAVLETDAFHLAYTSSNDLSRTEIVKVRKLLDKHVAGLLVQPAFRATAQHVSHDDIGNHAYFLKLFRSGVPVVLIDRSCAAHGVPCVCNDDRAGGRMAAEHMIARGFKHVVYLGAPGNRVGRLRYQGYLDAMADHALEPAPYPARPLANPGLWLDDAFVFRETRRLIDSLREPTAMVTSGRVPYILERLTRPPAYHGPDVAWIGYDHGCGPSESGHAPFPYMRRPIAEIGRRAAAKLLALMRGEPAAATEEFLKPDIVAPDR